MQKINYCLNNTLLEIYKTVNQLQTLQLKIEAFIPEELRPYCKVGSFNKGCLTLVTDNAVWATPLRYLLPEIRDKLRTEGKIYQLSTIKLQIQPELYGKVLPSKRRKSSLPKAAIMHLTEMARDCKFLPLKEALERMLSRSQSPGE